MAGNYFFAEAKIYKGHRSWEVDRSAPIYPSDMLLVAEDRLYEMPPSSDIKYVLTHINAYEASPPTMSILHSTSPPALLPHLNPRH